MEGGVKVLTNDFSFCIPIDVLKSEGSDNQEMRIAGYASTSAEDRQGDTIVQKGLDISDFLDYGFINYDHRSDVILGYPDKGKCKIDNHGFYVEGVLLKDVPLAKSVWDTAVALQNSGAPRKPGFSIEGKVLKRNAIGQIVKAKIYNVAITFCPVNTTCTFEALAKSFTSDQSEIEKALEAGQGYGSALIPESLDSAFKTLSYVVEDNEEAKQSLALLKKQLQRRSAISKAELTLYFQIFKGLSLQDSKALVEDLVDGGMLK